MADATRVLVATTWCLFAAVCAVWAVIGLLLLTGTVGVGPVAPWVVTVIAVLMLCNAAVMGLLAWWSLRGRAIVDSVAVVVVVLNIAATFTDEIGIPDLAYLALSLALLVSLLWSMRAVRVTQAEGCVH